MLLTKNGSKSALDSVTEKERIKVLQDYHVWDADMHKELHGLVCMASEICDAPLSSINLLDSSQLLTKVSVGFDAGKIPRESSFCHHTILGDDLMIVENAAEDERFSQCNVVNDEPNLRFYAGVPLQSEEGYNMGTLCVLDCRPRKLNTSQKKSLELLAREVDAHLRLNKKNHELEKKKRQLEMLSQAINSSLDGIAILDMESNFTYMNEAYADIYGYVKEELIGKPWDKLFDTENHTHLKQDINSQLESQQQWRGETVGIKKDGSQFPLEISLSSMETGGLVSNVRDLTERKQVQNRLKAEKMLNDKIIDGLPTIFFMFNSDGFLVRWNTNLKEASGYNDYELSCLYQTDFFPDDEKDRIDAKIKELYEKGRTSAEAEFLTKSGERVPFIFNATLFENNGRKFLVGIGQDINDQKQVQQKLSRSLEEKEVLLAEVHHRVKNNLAIISGLLELESFQSKDKSAQRSLKHSQMRIQSMATIHELLYKANEFTNLPFKSYIAKIVQSIEATYHQEDKNIRIEHDSDDITLNVNQAIPCALIINELVTNAYEHAFRDLREGVIQIELSGHENSIYLCVKDNGKGLPSDFDFENPGSLGLKLVGTLTKQLSADIYIEKVNGTTVCLTFKKQDIKGSSSALLKH